MSERARCAGVALIAAGLLTLPAHGLAQSFTATPLEPDTTYALRTKGKLRRGLTSVLVKLDAAALASYAGGLPGLAPTSPGATGARSLDVGAAASRAYLEHFGRKQREFEALCHERAPGARVSHSLPLIFGGVAMVVPDDEVEAVAALPGVVEVYPDELLQIATDASPRFIGALEAWSDLGGQHRAGQGIVVGVLDTGIWPEHPSFSDPDSSGRAYPSPPASWTGTACEFGSTRAGDDSFTCSHKLIGARRFMSTYDAVIGLRPEEFDSARDDNGHGTHTASTAAGNGRVEATLFGVARGRVSGIAPRAHVASYKVCGFEGCFTSDSVAAVQQAIRDGVDVINFSIGGGANPYSDAVELAFLDAYNAGVFVAASAGNSGPGANTTEHRGPWVTTVAASTQRRSFRSRVTLIADDGSSLELEGASITDGVFPAAELVLPPAGNESCTVALPPAVSGKVVVCRRGSNSRVGKGANAAAGGAAGMILYNQSAAVTDLETDNHFLPTVHLQFADGSAMRAFLAAHTAVKATFTAGTKEADRGDVVASFSSRGGPGLTLGVSKPDVTAPGVQILAGHTPLSADPDTGPQGELFQAIAGTSMSSPHVAGAAALLMDLHPDWTPGQVKSALMTTARTRGVVKEDRVTPAGPFDVGSGRIDLARAGWPGLTFDAPGADFVAFRNNLALANYPSLYVPSMPGKVKLPRTAESVLRWPSLWKLDVDAPRDLRIDVPELLYLPKGGARSFEIEIDASRVPIGEVRHATIELESHVGGRAHLPVTIVRQQAPVTFDKTCDPATFKKGETTECTITLSNPTFADATVKVRDKMPEELRLGVVTGATRVSSKLLVFEGRLRGGSPAGVVVEPGPSPAGYLPLSLFGVAPIVGMGDDAVVNFTVPAFTYASESYTRLGVTSNGTLIVGGASSSADATPVNQNLPSPGVPNNVLAPFWTDLNPAAGGGVRIGLLTDGVNTWIVADWEDVREFTLPRTYSFQVWIGVDPAGGVGEDVSYAYGTIQGNGDRSRLTVGAEDRLGLRGDTFYFDGTADDAANGSGTLPARGTELVVTTDEPTPGETKVIRFTARGEEKGRWRNCAEMTSEAFFGTSTACFSGEVTGRHRSDRDCDDDDHHHGRGGKGRGRDDDRDDRDDDRDDGKRRHR
jgi:subtilisin family serine protease